MKSVCSIDDLLIFFIAKHYVTEGSPVYVDETGECVTDLAFHVPLSQEAAEQQRFLMSEKKATTGSLGIPLQEEDFQAGGKFVISQF